MSLEPCRARVERACAIEAEFRRTSLVGEIVSRRIEFEKQRVMRTATGTALSAVPFGLRFGFDARLQYATASRTRLRSTGIVYTVQLVDICEFGIASIS